jgi:hypothetical protein
VRRSRISRLHRRTGRTIALASPLPPDAEREDPSPLSGQRAATYATTRPDVSPSPLNGERAGVRGEKVENLPIAAANWPDDRPRLRTSLKIRFASRPRPRPRNSPQNRGRRTKDEDEATTHFSDTLLPSPLPPEAEREDRRPPVAYPRACPVSSQSARGSRVTIGQARRNGAAWIDTSRPPAPASADMRRHPLCPNRC